jgi:hypothetical protein
MDVQFAPAYQIIMVILKLAVLLNVPSTQIVLMIVLVSINTVLTHAAQIMFVD